MHYHTPLPPAPSEDKQQQASQGEQQEAASSESPWPPLPLDLAPADSAAPAPGPLFDQAAAAGVAGGAPGGHPAQPGVLTWPCGRCKADAIPDEVVRDLDFVVVLGGDGTLLWTCHIFGNRAVPPLVPFNMGSLGFLTPFPPDQLSSRLQAILAGGFPLILRHRLHCTIVKGPRPGSQPAGGDVCWADGHCATEKVVLNEVVVDRGISPFLTNLECFCDGNFVTHVQGDGLIVSTPTGSTAYSLAAGGSMVHPQVPGILFTPVCPHSLSFRPLLFPDHVQLCIQVPRDARSQMYCSFDGKDRQELLAGDSVIIRMSQWPVPTVCSQDPSQDWFRGIQEGLHWNARRLQAGAGH
ncbi:ATP-NAD kinase-like domain-containing protein [Haematococcus lacustris]